LDILMVKVVMAWTDPDRSRVRSSGETVNIGGRQ